MTLFVEQLTSAFVYNLLVLTRHLPYSVTLFLLYLSKRFLDGCHFFILSMAQLFYTHLIGFMLALSLPMIFVYLCYRMHYLTLLAHLLHFTLDKADAVLECLFQLFLVTTFFL